MSASKPLTAAAVARFKPAAQRVEIPDVGCRGLYLVIQPSGAKSWALRYRRPDDRPAKLTLGTVFADGHETAVAPAIGGHLTLAAAHRLVTALKHEIAQGRDPAAEHAKQLAVQHAAANTLAGAARGFIEMHASAQGATLGGVGAIARPAAPSTFNNPQGPADRWGERPVASIDGHDIYGVIDEARRIGVPGLDSRSDKPSEARARHLFGVLSKLFAWLIQQRRVTVNPCVGVHRPETPKARDRVLSKLEKSPGSSGRPLTRPASLLLAC